MTVEIRQLVIRAVAEPQGSQPGGAVQIQAGSGGEGLSPAVRQALVAECVREVLRTLARRRER